MQNINLLVIEDEEQTRRKLVNVLKKEGFGVYSAMNGKTGIKTFKQKHPEVVIIDIKMPDINGIEVLKRIKKSSPATQIILTTGFSNSDIAISALQEGALDYLKKPINLKLLLLSLDRAKEKIIRKKCESLFPAFLVVEDEESTRKYLVSILKKEGWNTFEAENGRDAISVFEKERIDIVIMDIKMPEMDGRPTLKKMRQLTDDFEVIILSGFDNEEDIISAIRYSALSFIKKPIDLKEMFIFIDKAINKIIKERSLKYTIQI